MTPIDAIRNGQTGERFSKKSFMNLGRSKLSATSFLAANDLVSSPKRYSIMILTFFLCLSLMLMLSSTVFTMKSGTLVSAFGLAEYDISLVLSSELMDYMDEGGREKLKADLDDMEEQLARHGMPAICFQDMAFSLPVICEDKKVSIAVRQGTGITMDKYEYTEGTMPIHKDEIAITKISAKELGVNIGDLAANHHLDQLCFIQFLGLARADVLTVTHDGHIVTQTIDLIQLVADIDDGDAPLLKNVDDLEEETGVELESETSETIGGFIIDLMGEIPRENVKYRPISYEDYDFTILSVKDRRIEKIRIEKVEREEDSDE